MKPLGRRYFTPSSPCKYKVKKEGKHVTAWWEDIVIPCKRRERQHTKRKIRQEILNAN